MPDSLLIEEVAVAGRERGVCVQRRLKGTPLADSAKGIASDDVKALVADAGELLARLHSLPAEHEPRSGGRRCPTSPSSAPELHLVQARRS